MFDERWTRTLLGPADPARDLEVTGTPAAARDLIRRAETTTAGPTAAADTTVSGSTGSGAAGSGTATVSLPRRRLLTTAAVVTALGAAGAVMSVRAYPPASDAALDPSVLRPISLQLADDPPAAGSFLRSLADRITDAPYDGKTGRYAYHRETRWGAGVVQSPEGHLMGKVVEVRSWATDDTVILRQTGLEPQYPDEESRRYFEARSARQSKAPGGEEGYPSGPTETVSLYGTATLPRNPAALRESLSLDFPSRVPEAVSDLYRRFAVPRPVRADILRVLAGLPGLRWRGAVTDRAGRPGVAVSLDAADGMRQVLIFEPRTGELRAGEWTDVRVGERRVSAYSMIHETGWTDTQP